MTFNHIPPCGCLIIDPFIKLQFASGNKKCNLKHQLQFYYYVCKIVNIIYACKLNYTHILYIQQNPQQVDNSALYLTALPT